MKDESKSILLNTGIIGMSQLILILVTILRSKLSALLLGAEGMGIIYMISNSLGVVGTITNLGFGTIALRNIARSRTTNKLNNSEKLITHYQLLSWLTGLLGLITTILLSYFLSIITFGNNTFTINFIFLSSTILLAQLNTSFFTTIQGLRLFKLLALSNIIAGIISLIIGFLIMWFFGRNGITSLIFTYSVIPALISFYFFKKLNLSKSKINSRYLKILFYNLLKDGFMISLTRVLPLASSMILFFIMNKYGSSEIVGLYTAGFSIIFNYSNLLFISIEGEYFTRISQLNCNKKLQEALNYQLSLILTFITPIIICFIIFIDFVLQVLFTKDFLVISGMIKIAMIGLFFKGLYWPLNYFYLVKNNSKKYFAIELIGSLILLVFNIIMYTFYGLNGLGISFLFSQIVFFFVVYYFIAIDFQIRISYNTMKYASSQLIFCIIIWLVSLSKSIEYFNYGLLLFVIYFNLKYLNKLTNISFSIRRYLRI